MGRQRAWGAQLLLTGRVEEAANSKGEIVVTDLAEYTQREVMPWAEGFRGKKQPPWLDQSGGAKLVLVETRLGVVQAEQSRLEEIGSGAATTATSPTGQQRGLRGGKSAAAANLASSGSQRTGQERAGGGGETTTEITGAAPGNDGCESTAEESAGTATENRSSGATG